MYTDFYGLKERPFALLPDPRFLFLSASHREALAHLLYGVEAGEGFIQVTGQVGTGKTTLCRTLLGRIGADTEIAYIFNPSPSATELLSAINREFGLPTAARSRAQLIDQLNAFLLEKRTDNRRVLLVIDEAQNLEPGVLEQIRLLSNLETEHEKLLQIVLIGQPELEENLSRTDLRQLRQRITVRWRLHPCTRGEVGDYLRHRLQVAGLERGELFTRRAVRALYRASRGVPRVINAIADRALLAGYTAGQQQIDARTVRRAARELPSSELARVEHLLGVSPGTAAAMVVSGLSIGLFATVWWPQAFASGVAVPAGQTRVQAEARLLPSMTAPEGRTLAASDQVETGGEALRRHLLERGARVTAAGALEALLAAWGHAAAIGPEVDPNMFASAVREVAPLRVFVTRADRDLLRRLNLPAIIELELKPDQRRYAAVLGLGPDGHVLLASRDEFFELESGELDPFWTGRTFYVWSNFESMPALSPGMNGSAVRWLQARLTDLGYLRPGDPSGKFDAYTVAAIREFQGAQGLDDNGQVGPKTLIALYQRLDYPCPQLTDPEEPS